MGSLAERRSSACLPPAGAWQWLLQGFELWPLPLYRLAIERGEVAAHMFVGVNYHCQQSTSACGKRASQSSGPKAICNSNIAGEASTSRYRTGRDRSSKNIVRSLSSGEPTSIFN